MGTIALGRKQALSVIIESVFKTFIAPGAANKVMILGGGSVNTQSPEFRKDEQIRDSRDEFSRLKGKTPPGDFSFSINGKPSGTAGTAPDASDLLQAALGAVPSVIPAGLTCLTGSTASILKVTTGQIVAANVGDLLLIEGQVVAIQSVTVGAQDDVTISPALTGVPAVDAPIGRSVNYRLATAQPSILSMFKDDHTVFMQLGGVIEDCTVSIVGKEEVKLDFKGKYAQQIKTGTDEVGAGGVADGATTTWAVADLAKYDIGSRFDCETETNVEVTGKSADTGAGDLTVVRGSSPAAHAATTVMTPWMPAGTDSGIPVHGRAGKTTIDGVVTPFTDFNANIKNGVKMIDEEAGDDFATDYIANEREITGSTKLFFRKEDLKHFENAKNQVPVELLAKAGNTAGAIIATYVKKAEMDVPKISGNQERLLDVSYKGLGSVGNDVITIGFL